MILPVLLFLVGADYSGTWICQADGNTLIVLTLDSKGGALVRPKNFHLDGDGDVSNVSPEIVRSVIKWTRRPGEFRVGSDRYRLTLLDRDRATLADLDLPWLPVELRRARPSDNLTVPSPWPEPRFSPGIVELQRRIHAMVEKDQAVRVPGRISAPEMEETDRRHSAELQRIFETYGWPAKSVIGKSAAHDYWLLVQHQPLAFQQLVLPAMERAMEKGEASRTDYAYLYDRVRMGEGKPQRWGTQAKCVNGLAVLYTVEDAAGLDARRRDLRMPPIRDYMNVVKSQCVR